MNKINEATLYFLFKSEKKADEGHLKQMRDRGPEKQFLYLFGQRKDIIIDCKVEKF